MLRTRALESKRVIRTSVVSAEVAKIDGAGLVLRTVGVRQIKAAQSSADPMMFDQMALSGLGEKVAGTVRIDLWADDILRVRYAEGDDVPAGDTPMLVGHPAPPAGAAWSAGEGALTIATDAMTVTVTLEPYRIEIRDAQARPITGVGGPEKDNFRNWDSYNTGLCRPNESERPFACENFDLAPTAAVLGLGEQFIRLNKAGQTIDLDMADGLGVTTPRSYKNVPFWMTTAGWGCYFNHSARMTVWAGSMSACDVQVAVDDDFLDYFVLVGSVKRLLKAYTDLTGLAGLPPRWSFGYWQSKISYHSAQECLDVVRKMRDNDVPMDVIHVDTDWFDTEWICDLRFSQDRFPDPAGWMRQLAEMGVKVSLWQLPYVPGGTQLFDDLAAAEGFVKNADGEIYDCKICFSPKFAKSLPVGVVDFTSEGGCEVFGRYCRDLFEAGVKVIKTDFGEAAPDDGVYADGTPGYQMHNRYPLDYNRLVSAVTKDVTGDAVVWARSAWAGGQRYPIHWGGDSSPNWANLVPQLAGGLSLGLSGFAFWSQDIGGFNGATTDKLLIRWMQWGMFCSHSRIHGAGDREVYAFEPETMRICRDYIRLRYSLLPYIVAEAEACVAASLPMARALVVEYPDDPVCAELADQYLFGSGLLVAPIFDQTDRRRVYLPAGVWTDWWTGRRIAGPRWIDVQADLETLPLYVREGAIIPTVAPDLWVDQHPWEAMELRVSPLEAPGRTELAVPLADGSRLELEYDFDGRDHRVRAAGATVDLTIIALGECKMSLHLD